MLKLLAAAVAAVLLTAGQAAAHGAIAIGGSTAKIEQNGVAVGISTDDAAEDAANQSAIERCRAYASKRPAETTARCAVVVSFTHEWVVFAMDPKEATPGFGWSVDADKAVAERNAMSQCKASSTDERKPYCVLSGELQDTKP